MKILYIGEIVGDPGRKVVKNFLPQIREEYQPDFVIANAENLSGGRGITVENLKEMSLIGIDYFTGGDHVFWQKDTESYIDSLPVVVPANYPVGTAGNKYALIDTGKFGNILLTQVMGRTAFSSLMSYLDDPFRKADEILEKTSNENISCRIVDIHAECTSEKYALAHYLDGRVDVIVGSHTHVPTSDTLVLPKGTLYVTDAGMSGAIDSALGVKKEIVINMYLTARNQKFEWESAGRKAFRSVLFDTAEKTIFRIDKMTD